MMSSVTPEPCYFQRVRGSLRLACVAVLFGACNSSQAPPEFDTDPTASTTTLGESSESSPTSSSGMSGSTSGDSTTGSGSSIGPGETSSNESSDTGTELEPPPSELRWDALYDREVVDCFPALERGSMLERAYVYKRVFAQEIDDVEQPVDLNAYVFSGPDFDPGRDTPRAAVVLFHGGGWCNGTPVLWIPAARYLAARGMVAVVVQYRLGDSHDATPRQSTADALSAIRWLRQNANALGVDPERIATAGDSAGGHLALATSTLDAISDEGDGADEVSPRSHLNFALYPVSHPSRLNPPLEEIDPYVHLGPDAVPTFILHGVLDELRITPPEDSENYCTRVEELSEATCTYVPIEGLGHNFLPLHHDSSLAFLDAFLIGAGFAGGDASATLQYTEGAAEHCRFDGPAYLELQEEYNLPESSCPPPEPME